MLQRLKEILRAKPFGAFRLIVLNGDRFEVNDRWQIAIGLTQIRFLFPRSDRGATLKIDDVTAIEPLRS
jgi:hypothetical protein